MFVSQRQMLRTARIALDELRAIAQGMLTARVVLRAPPAAMVRQLEDRILLSVAPAAAVADVATADTPTVPVSDELLTLAFAAETTESDGETTDATAATDGPVQGRHELVFVDPLSHDFEQLLDDLRDAGDTFEIFVLEPSRDGVQQINEALGGRTDVDAIHLVTHGTTGAVKLGDTWLRADNLDAYAEQVTRWSDALKPDADLLLYGCDMASNELGRSFVESLGALTGADIAASMDLTGHAELGGNWELEFHTGAVETSVVFSGSLQEDWHGLLAVISVNTTNDVLDGNTSSVAALLGSAGPDGFISLREAIIATNNTAGADTILLPPGTFTIAIGGRGENAAVTGDLDITDSLTITGAGSGSSVIDANGLDRVFDVRSGATTQISGVTIREGDPGGGSGGGVCVALGADLTLTGVKVTANNATVTTGAGIWNAGVLSLIDSEVSGNTTDFWGGGIYNNAATITMDRVTIANNSAGNDGGGIYSFGGGASISLTNVTISGNSSSGDGGGIYTNRLVTITNSTIAANTAASGGAGVHAQSPGSADLRNTIVAANNGFDVAGTFVSLGNNLIGNVGTASGLSHGVNGDQVGSSGSPIDPLLGNLAYNGGLTPTHVLLAGSPAINTGTNLGAPAVDARGFERVDGRTDIGAFEANALLLDTIYWVDQTNRKIQRADLDGSNVVDVLTAADGVNSPTGLLVDSANGKVYWSEYFAGNICRANLDGTNIQTLYSGLDSPAGMALDTANGLLYWTENPLFVGMNRIRRADMDGGGPIENLVTTGTNDPVDLTLDLEAGKIYWTDGISGEIRRANLDGTSGGVFLAGLTAPQGLELDPGARKLYWASDGGAANKIQRAIWTVRSSSRTS